MHGAPNTSAGSAAMRCRLLGEWSHILDRFIFQRDGHTGDDLIVMLDNGPKTTLMTSKGTLSNRAVKSNAASLTRQRWDETRRVNHPPISMFRVSVTLQLVFGCGPHSEQRTYGIADRLDENNDFPALT